MIAYNKEWLYNMYVRRQTDESVQDCCISAETRERIYAQRPVGFYQVGFWGGVGFALVMWLVIAAVTGLFEVVFHAYESSTLSLTVGIACYIMAEIVIKHRHHYNSGVDNMLIWAAGAGLQIGLIVALTDGRGPDSTITASFIVFIISGLLALRFADQLLSSISAIGLLCFVYFSWVHGTGYRGSSPYVMIALSAALYFISYRYLRSYSTLFYRSCLQCINGVALVALYASGNFFIVKELYQDFDFYCTQLHEPMFSDWFFWIWTFVIPVVYIVIGLRKKDLSHIRAGAILFVISIITFRYYHTVMSKEAALIIAGVILTTLSYVLIKYLATPKHGFTFQPRNAAGTLPVNAADIAGHVLKKELGQL